METKLIVCLNSRQLESPPEGCLCAHLVCRLSPSGELLRARGREIPGHTLVLTLPRDLSGPCPVQDVLHELERLSYRALLLDCDGPVSPAAAAAAGLLCRQVRAAGRSVFAAPELAHACVGAAVLVSSAVTSGSFSRALSQAQASYGSIALLLEPLCADHALTSGSGARPLSREQLERLQSRPGTRTFYSQELCADYLHYREGQAAHFVLWDTAGTCKAKLRECSRLGVEYAFAPYREIASQLTEFSAFLRPA